MRERASRLYAAANSADSMTGNGIHELHSGHVVDEVGEMEIIDGRMGSRSDLLHICVAARLRRLS